MARDPYKYFRLEGRDLAEQMNAAVLAFDASHTSADVVHRLLRLAHTLKGAARVVKQPRIAECAHAFESILVPFRESPSPLPAESISGLLGLLDNIGQLINALDAPLVGTEPAAAPVSARPADEMFHGVRADSGDLDRLANGVTEAFVLSGTLRKRLSTVEKSRHLAALVNIQAANENLSASQSAARELRSWSGELIGVLEELERESTRELDRLESELRQLSEAVDHLRLIPAGAVFTSLARAVRDAAQSVNKRVVFEGTGSEIRLDSEVLGGLQAALIQLARNAVVHGIENESARTASGKTGTGKIVFRVARSGRQITFSCTDDGKGIDLERIREVAVRRGLVSADAAVDREELLRMLFRSGVSTTATATEVSGRGVGLDVVQETAQRFGGAVHIETEDGTGTTVSITVPLSVASLEVLLVQDGPAAATIAIPADAVRRTLRLSRHEVRSAADRAGVIVDEKVVPFVGLQDVLTPEATVASWETCFAAVVDGRSGAAAFGVERMIGIAKIVLRPLPAVVPRAPIVAGAAFDAEGNVILILDPDALVAAALNRGDSFSPAAKKSSPARILVVDDSLTTRMLEQSILESAGYDVEIAASAEEALSKTATTAYSLFLVDVEMPGMDGVDFVRTTRQSPGLKNTPAILVTSRSSPEDRQRGLEAGASEYIVKSEFDQARLLQRIRELVK